MSANAQNEIPSGALAAVWSVKRLWLLHAFGNALLLAAGYSWLWIPDANILQLSLSLLLGVATVFAALWLHGGTLACFRALHQGHGARLWPEFRAALRRLPALLLWLLVVLVLLWFIGLADEQAEPWSDWWASWLTLHLHKPVLLKTVDLAFTRGLWFLRWILLPLITLPFALQVSAHGFAGLGISRLRGAWNILRSLRWWIGYALLFAVAWYLPAKIVAWVPTAASIKLEIASASARFLLGYLIVVSGWLVLCSLLGRLGRGDATDDSHAAGVREPQPVGPRIGHSSIGASE